MNLYLAPHNDDEALFGAFTLMREHPLVVIVTDSWIQFNRGDKITADQRWEETKKAMDLLECPVIRLGIRDDIIDEWSVKDKLGRFYGFNTVYAPAIQGGNAHHDLIGKVADELFKNVKHYTTYEKGNLSPVGKEGITPTVEEVNLKNRVLECYQSQINLPATAPHFQAVRGRTEWFI